MSTQPTNNGIQMQVIPLAEVYAKAITMDRWQYVLDELEKAPAEPEPAIKLTFRNRYTAVVCAREMRSLINSRGIAIGISQKADTVCVWKLSTRRTP